jgi:hypothetical protein
MSKVCLQAPGEGGDYRQEDRRTDRRTLATSAAGGNRSVGSVAALATVIAS